MALRPLYCSSALMKIGYFYFMNLSFQKTVELVCLGHTQGYNQIKVAFLMGLVRREKKTYTKVTWLSDACENVSSGIRERWKRTHVRVHCFFAVFFSPLMNIFFGFL